MINFGDKWLELEKLFFEKKVRVAYLFGSQANAKVGPLSDIDIAILVDSEIPKNDYFEIKIYLISELMYILGTNKIDVVILNEASPLLKYEVISSGKIIFNPDESARIDFEVKGIKEYLDTKEIRDIYDSYFIDELTSVSK